MTKKDYERISRAILDARIDIRGKEPDEDQRNLLDGVSFTAEYIADVLKQDNPRFDRERFLAACDSRL